MYDKKQNKEEEENKRRIIMTESEWKIDENKKGKIWNNEQIKYFIKKTTT